jgi:hypothetical protein
MVPSDKPQTPSNKVDANTTRWRRVQPQLNGLDGPTRVARTVGLDAGR